MEECCFALPLPLTRLFASQLYMAESCSIEIEVLYLITSIDLHVYPHLCILFFNCFLCRLAAHCMTYIYLLACSQSLYIHANIHMYSYVFIHGV